MIPMRVVIAVVAATPLLLSCGGGSSAGPGDGAVPVATLTAPTALASNLAGTIALSATASDDVGVVAVEFQIDGVTVGNAAGVPYSVNVDTTPYASGQHVVRAQARDAAGNLSPWSSATVQFGGTRAQPAGFTRETWVTGLTNATAFAQAPDGRFFVTEQGGTVRIIKNGVLLATPFHTLTVDSPAGSERGLLGVALHPDFANNRLVYLYHTTPEGGVHNRIRRFLTGTGTGADRVSVGSEVPIADLPPLSGATNHNGGAMHFGADGKLYVAVGDNANGANAQSMNTRLGKMLRLNDDGTIPADNPFFATASGDNRAIWATGLRNPFTFSVRAGDGRMHINDVGEGTWEEVNLGAAGANYGWPSTEGPTTAAGVTAPLFAYDHDAGSAGGVGGFFSGCAIIGGTFYPTTGGTGAFPQAYRGSYFFTDLCTTVIGRIDLDNGNAAYAFGRVGSAPVGMLTGIDGALYVLRQGAIERFTFP
jgi:glucose/arabinose dehydrogenase